MFEKIILNKDITDMLSTFLIMLLLFIFGVIALLVVTRQLDQLPEEQQKQSSIFLTPAQKDVIINEYMLMNGYVSNKAYQSVMRSKVTDDIQVYNIIEEHIK